MEKERFIHAVAKKLHEGMCDLFVGAGISVPSGFPTWGAFLQPFLSDLGIYLQENDDYPLLAQYIVNQNTCNRNVLAEAVCNTFGKDNPINSYHSIIKNYPVSTVWTTNYDNLLEKAFYERNPRTIRTEDTYLHPYTPTGLEIIKLHGDALCAAKGIVLTRDDYNNFLYHKQMIAQRLRETIIHRSLFFIGYGFQDPDIQYIMAQAANMKESTTNSHFILLREIEQKSGESNDAYEQRRRRVSLWVNELRRIGINELIVSAEDYLKVLSDIERASRGNSVVVTGTHKAKPEEESLALKIGKTIAYCNEAVLNCGQSIGVSNSAFIGFVKSVFENKQEIRKRLQLFTNPYALSASYADDPSQLPHLKSARDELISATSVVIAFQGGMGTEAEVELALAKERLVFPVIMRNSCYENPVIKKILDDSSNMEHLELYVPVYCQLLKSRSIPDEDQLLSAVIGVINGTKMHSY